MIDYFSYTGGTDASSSEATPMNPQPPSKLAPATVTTTSSSTSAMPVRIETVPPALTETAATPATFINGVFEQTAKEYKKAAAKVIIRRYGK